MDTVKKRMLGDRYIGLEKMRPERLTGNWVDGGTSYS
jgi:hypothetical protein